MMNSQAEKTFPYFFKWIDQSIPRLLTQCGRDKDSDGYGSFDRNWWHYKIRDFSSIILQQGGLALSLAAELPVWREYKNELNQLAKESAKFWNRRAVNYGAFEEYYPWEQGYPPLAFSTLAVLKLVDRKVVNYGDIQSGVSKAVQQLKERFESQAANQQVAGVAALAYIKKHDPSLVSEDDFNAILGKTLSLQNEDGWFVEYGGPDLGYLSVTIDCLWDLYDVTGNIDVIRAAEKALEFIYKFMELPVPGAGMHNSRNTDYIVTYGISRFLGSPQFGGYAKRVIEQLLINASEKEHFLNAIDDRYLSHYIGCSMIATANVLLKKYESDSPGITNVDKKHIIESSGHLIVNPNNGFKYSSLISLLKGGIVSLWPKNGRGGVEDFGWRYQYKGVVYVTHWWDQTMDVEYDESGTVFSIQGKFIPYSEVKSSPLKHFILRSMSLFFGGAIIGVLKRRMIFKTAAKNSASFVRRVELGRSSVNVHDSFYEVPEESKVYCAGRSSIRHVASADSFHFEDLRLLESKSVSRSEDMHEGEEFLEVTTIYNIAD